MTNGTGQKRRIGLVLSGVPTAMTLMSGAMLGFMEKGIEFDAISTSGAGALIALLALAPKGKTAKEALENLPNLYVSDAISSLAPFNFKLLSRNSPFSRPMYELSKRLPHFPLAPKDRDPLKRLFNDWIDLACTALTPPLELSTQALLSHNPRIADLVDFDKIRHSPTRFYLAAFDLSNKKLRIFDQKDTDLDAYYGAESLTLFFPPQRVHGGDLHNSALAHDATGLQAIWLREKQQLDMVLALDPLSAAFWREPTDIWDAFKLMLTNPFIALETLTLGLFARTDRAVEELGGAARPLPRLYRVAVPLGDHPAPSLLKWTHSGAVALQEIGYRAALSFADILLSGDSAALEAQRFYASPESPRMTDFMQVLDPLFEELIGKRQPARAAPRPRPTAAKDEQPPRPMPAEGEDWWRAPSGLGLVASGGAPSLHLAAGALCAFHEKEIGFDVIGAAGGGATASLIYAAPKDESSRVRALQSTVNLNVSDLIYRFIPVNYKGFFKAGPFTQWIWRFGRLLPRFPLGPEARFDDELKRLYNDMLDLCLAMLTPSTLNWFSKGMCTPLYGVDEVVAWERLHDYPKELYVNAFNVSTQRLETFDKEHLTAETFAAAGAMPWLFEPVKINGRTYTEGASQDPSGLEALGLEAERWPAIAKLDKIVAFDTIGPELWTDPGGIFEALQMTIMEPLVSLAELVLSTYGLFEYVVNTRQPGTLPRLYRVPFPVPDWEVSKLLKWNYSNAVTLWHVGHKSASGFVEALRRDAREGTNMLESYRYYPSLKSNQRMKEMLALFTDLEPVRAVLEAAGQ